MTNVLAEDILFKYFRILDFGYVGLVDFMGNDESIVEAARVSYGKGTKKTSDSETLIRYMANHKHTSVFEMCVLKFNISMPIHCDRQHSRHRQSSKNEYSGRYSIVPEVTYDSYDFNLQSKNNKQGRSENTVEGDFRDRITALHNSDFKLYGEMVDAGVAREIARMHLPLNTYTYFYWKIDLHNLFHYLTLRCDGHAQYEIRQYANCMAGIVKHCYPLAFKAWYDYSYGAVHFSRQDRILLNEVLRAGQIDKSVIESMSKKLGMSGRELTEFYDKLLPPTEQSFELTNFEEIVNDSQSPNG